MKKTLLCLLVVVLIGAAGFVGWYIGQQEYDAGFQEGRELGYEEGHSVGYEEGLLAAQTGEEEPEENVSPSLTLESLRNSKVVREINESPDYMPTGERIVKQYNISGGGEVKGISVQTQEIIIVEQGDELTLRLEPDTLVLAWAPGETLVKDGITYQGVREARFEDIEIGEYVLIQLKWSIELWPEQPLKVLFITISS